MAVTRYEGDTGSVLHPAITMATNAFVVLEYVRMYLCTVCDVSTDPIVRSKLYRVCLVLCAK